MQDHSSVMFWSIFSSWTVDLVRRSPFAMEGTCGRMFWQDDKGSSVLQVTCWRDSEIDNLIKMNHWKWRRYLILNAIVKLLCTSNRLYNRLCWYKWIEEIFAFSPSRLGFRWELGFLIMRAYFPMTKWLSNFLLSPSSRCPRPWRKKKKASFPPQIHLRLRRLSLINERTRIFGLEL